MLCPCEPLYSGLECHSYQICTFRTLYFLWLKHGPNSEILVTSDSAHAFDLNLYWYLTGTTAYTNGRSRDRSRAGRQHGAAEDAIFSQIWSLLFDINILLMSCKLDDLSEFIAYNAASATCLETNR